MISGVMSIKHSLGEKIQDVSTTIRHSDTVSDPKVIKKKTETSGRYGPYDFSCLVTHLLLFMDQYRI